MQVSPTVKPCRCEHPLRDSETCLYCGRVVPAADSRQPEQAITRDRWTRAGVVRALRAFEFFRGRAPSRDDWSQRMAPDWPPLAVVERLFGSLSEAVAAAGLDRPGRIS
jgi:hypothetical protein